jgi:hypothetical protein
MLLTINHNFNTFGLLKLCFKGQGQCKNSITNENMLNEVGYNTIEQDSGPSKGLTWKRK